MPSAPRSSVRSRYTKRLSHDVRKQPPPVRSNIRRVFRNSTSQEAQVYVIRAGKRKHVFFRVGHDSHSTIRKYILHKIFYALYPQYGIKPLGLVVATIDGRQVVGMTSEIVRPRSHEYKWYHHTFYNDPALTIRSSHIAFADKQLALAEKIEKDSGIIVSNHPINIIDQSGKPVFAEVEEIQRFSRVKLAKALLENKIDISALKQNILKNTPPDKRSLVNYFMETII